TLPSAFARAELAASGVVILSGLTHVGVAIRQALLRARFKFAPPPVVSGSVAPATVSHLKPGKLSEADSKSLLREAGIAVPDEVLVTGRSGLDEAITRVGFPLVMKIQSADIPHKSEVGGVRVNISTKGEAFSVYRELTESVPKQRPDATIQGVLVGPMAKKGVEVIIGALQDGTFGPLIMIGLGGITTE